MNLSQLEVLSKEEIKKVHDSSIEILSEIGIKIKSKKVLQHLEDRGVKVDYDKEIAIFDPDIIKSALKKVPEEIEIFSREKNYSFRIGKNFCPRVVAGIDSVYLYNFKTKKRHPIKKKEVGIFAKIANYLSEIDIVAPEGTPQDVNPKAGLLHGIEAVLSNTIKPIYFSLENQKEVSSIIEIIKVVTDNNNINIRPIGICQFSPTSPLLWQKGTIEGLVQIVKEGFPCTIIPCPVAGMSGPYNIAANIVQLNVEFLSGATIAQLFNPGAPLLYGIGGVTFDMKKGTVSVSSSEAFLQNIAGVQMAKNYKIPSYCMGLNSDSHVLDEQQGFEKMHSILSNINSGANVSCNAGLFASGMTSSFEQLIIDNEILKCAKRYLKGISFGNFITSIEAIKRIIYGGDFFTDKTTLELLRNEDEHMGYDIISRQNYHQWVEKGSKDILESANLFLKEILKKRENISLDNSKLKKVKKILKEYELKGD